MLNFFWLSKRNITCGIFLLAGFGLISGPVIADELSGMDELQKKAPKTGENGAMMIKSVH